ncbi:MAG: porin family protein [Planctomycetes bacterium]|nr:porin family protein [Planctomycetota bacterium]
MQIPWTKLCTLSALALTGCMSTQPATDDQGCLRTGPYVGVGAIYAIENFHLSDAEAASGTSISAEDSPGIDLRTGYRFDRHAAIEAVVQDYFGGHFSSDGVDFGKYDGESLTLNLKVYPTELERLQPYFLVGGGVLHANFADTVGLGVSDSQTSFLGRIGLGADAYLSPNVVLDVEGAYSIPSGDLQDFRYTAITLGLQFRF